MWPTRLLLATFVASFFLVPCVQAIEASPVEMWECPGPEGTTLYTNKERPECQPKVLKALSVVPSMADTVFSPSVNGPSLRPAPAAKDYSYDTPIGALRNLTQIPDYGRDWYAGNTAGGSVQGEVCSMYTEWIHLNQNSRGGHIFGTDPSYGGTPTAQNWYAPSYSFYDNARYVTLSRIFGAGFIPIGCR